MSLSRALLYFVREACVSLVRSWKVSLLAVLTIMVSLFLGGVFLLISGNLEQMIDRWSSESKIVVYLEAAADESALDRLSSWIAEAPWAADVEAVSAQQARARFGKAFPSLENLLDGWEEEPLPASFEVLLAVEQIKEASFGTWLDELRSNPAVSMVDDDRDWLKQLEAVVFVIRGLSMVLGVILLCTAIFTISSVIRLTAYLYRDEIAVMRMVGATEFFIRGPFYMEGLLQGIAGGVLAVGVLFGAFSFFNEGSTSLFASVLTSEFLDSLELVALVGTGGIAGLFGAVASLRKETLGQSAESPAWSLEGE